MTDDIKELLTLAAKAAGIDKIGFHETLGIEHIDGSDDSPYTTFWNPLKDDGDAFRLAVKLGFAIHCPDMTDPSAVVEDYNGVHVREESNDHYATTRCAIVRAAAEIGRTMK